MTPGDAALRALLSRAQHDQSPDLIALAELTLAAGHRDAARTLFEGAFVGAGFSSRQRARQAQIAARTGLWPERTFAMTPPDHAALPPNARAVADLARLLAAPPLPDGTGRLFEALAGDGQGLDRALAAVAAPQRADDDIAALAGHLAHGALAPLLPLATPPVGSAALFHAAARAEEGGLGPYLSNLGTLIRDGRDAIGLIVQAGGTSIDRAAAILALRLPPGTVHDLVDRLADAGLADAVRAILATRSTIDGPVWAIRDAALDLADFATAEAAQGRIADANPGSAVEWIVLGEILATAGRFAAAETAFERGLAIDPDHPGGAARRAAARSGDFSAYAVAGGFGTPAACRRIRIARRR